MDYSRIGSRIKEYREKQKMTQQMLGEETDYSVQIGRASCRERV